MSAPNTYVGRWVALTRCPAQYENETGELEDVQISGLWEVLDFEAEDRTVGIFGECFVLGHTAAFGHDDGRLIVSVQPDDLIEQIDPAAHMASIEFEREHSFHGEREAEADIDGIRDHRFGYPAEGIVRVHPPEIPDVPVPPFPTIRLGGEA